MLTSAPLSRDTVQVETRLSASEIANISLRQLKIFVTVARKASFTRAADEFGLTQSAVSRCIRELEDELHLRLFDRTTRQVALTQAGHYLVARVSPLLEEIEATLRDSHGAQDGQRGVVHVSSSPMLSSILMPSCIAGCRNTYPNISLGAQGQGSTARPGKACAAAKRISAWLLSRPKPTICSPSRYFSTRFALCCRLIIRWRPIP